MAELTEEEAARLLGVHVATIRRWVRQGFLTPADGTTSCFTREELERWARARGFHLGARRRQEWQPEADLLADSIERGTLLRDADVQTAAEAIDRIVLAVRNVAPKAREELLAATREREQMASTALGHGIAVPHPRKPRGDLFPEPVVCVLFPREPIDWAAPDGEPVHTVLLVLSPSAPVHLELLARIAQALRSPGFVALLRERPAKEELVARIREIPREV